MNRRAPSLTAFVAFAFGCAIAYADQPSPAGSPAAAASASNPTLAASAGETLIKSAIAEMDLHQSVSAKLRQQIDLFGHQLAGSGFYLQQGRADAMLLRLELKVPVAERVSSLLQVCDGHSFWVHQDLFDGPSLSRINLDRVRAARLSQPPTSDSPLSLWPAVGGLPKFLRNLNEFFFFTEVNETRLDNVPVWSMQGTWERQKLLDMLPDQKDAIAGGQPDFTKLMEHLPDRVRILLGRDDLFPYRVEYWRSTSKKGDKGSGQPRLILLTEMYEVQLDGRVDPHAFAYSPGGLRIEDQTAGYLKKLGLTEPVTNSASRARGVR